MAKPTAILVGFLGKLPYAGMSLFNLHYIAGLRDLGYDVHYVERISQPWECYDPETDSSTDDPSCAVRYLQAILPTYGITTFSLVDRENNCHGTEWSVLKNVLSSADFLLTLAEPVWFDEMERCPQRLFLDGDPVFTQAAMISGEAEAISRYDPLFTYAARIGAPDCFVPDAGRQWIATRPPVCTQDWTPQPAPATDSMLMALLHWKAGQDVVLNGQEFGHKDREFLRFLDLPRRSSRRIGIAVGGKAPLDRLRENQWMLIDPLKATQTIPAYRDFIADSWADFGISKHAYVQSRSGWFSDRSTCYLASGRPVLHQDTGFGEWLPSDEGVLTFSDPETALDAIHRLELDYTRHALAARRIAEEYFEAKTVVGKMLDDAGLR